MNLIVPNPPPKNRKGTTVAKTRRRRKWGSAKQRAALSRMLAANRRGKKARRRARRNPPATTGAPAMARRRSRRPARRYAKAFTRARRSARRAGGALGKYLPAGTVPAVAGGVAGFVGANLIVGKLTTPGASGKSILPASMATGPARIAVKAAAAIAAGYLARRFAGRSLGNAIGTGALMAVGLDVVNLALNKVSGAPPLAGYSPGGDNDYAQLEGSGDQDGMGNYAPDLAGAYETSDGLYN